MSDAYTFDAVVLGDRECDAWVHYYRHEWAPFLGLGRTGGTPRDVWDSDGPVGLG